MTSEALLSRLGRMRARMGASLWIERLVPALSPAAVLLAAGVIAALFGVLPLLPPWMHGGVLAAYVAALAVALWHGLRQVSRPTTNEIDRRLERDSGALHQPLRVLADRPAMAGAAATALWNAHVQRAAAQAAALRAGWPRLGGMDRRGVGGLLAVLLVAGVFVAGPDAPDRLRAAVVPGATGGPAAPAPLLQAWVTPPAYTGLPPMFLHPPHSPADAVVAVPAGSRLTVSLSGGSGEPDLTLGDAHQAFTALDPISWQAERAVGAGGVLAVRRRGRALGQWTLTIIPDLPPMVAWSDPPGPATGRRRLQTRLPWTAGDDYGIVSLQAELQLAGRPAGEPLRLTIPVPAGAARQAHGAQVADLTANPWAGLPVVATLVGKDAPGQVGRSAPAPFTLPERAFKNPVARALIDIRKRLTLRPEDHEQAAADVTALGEAPQAFDNNTSVMLGLSSTAGILSRSGAPADVAEAQQRLWALALQLEDDAVSRTAQAIQAARDALTQEAQKRQDGKPEGAKPEGAKPEGAKPGEKTEMDRKAEALRQAIQKHLQALAEQARRDGTLMPFDPKTRTLNQRDFDTLTRQMQEDARAGRMDDAKDKLAQLEQMLEQLKQAEQNPGDRRQAQQQRRRGRQEMGAAEDMIERETAMKQRADARADPAAGDAERTADAAQQRALRRALGEMMQQFGDLTGKVPPALSEADLAMRDAAGALSATQDPQAATAEQHVVDALKKGEQQMSQQMASSLGISVQPGEGEGSQPGGDPMGEADGQGEGDGTGMAQNDQSGDQSGDPAGDGQGEADADAGTDRNPNGEPRDPLGRSTRDGTTGRADGGSVQVPEAMERARTRDLQAELRRRGAERTRPPGELDYIDRLLKAF